MHIWALTDHRPGNNSQSLGLAEALADASGASWQPMALGYAALPCPSLHAPGFFWPADSDSTQRLKAARLSAPPNLVIAAGWRAGRVALGLRRMLPGLKIVQLMDPYGAYGCFDAIYLPSHDRKARSLAQKHRHIGMTTGALHRLTQEKIVAAARHTTPILSALPERYLLVMLGGSTRRGKMTEADAKRLARSISKRAEATGLAVALVTSRRTPTDSRRWMQRDLPPGSRWLEWSSQPDWPNPYPAVLAKAAEIVVTGDSMSMLSEACITGQLVWIADIGAAVSDKHRRFHRLLEQAGHAMPLAGDQDFSPIILDETHRVAADIMHQEWYCSALDA